MSDAWFVRNGVKQTPTKSFAKNLKGVSSKSEILSWATPEILLTSSSSVKSISGY